MSNIFTRTITNELYSLESLMNAITNFLEDQEVDGQAVYRINLALEEMVTNIIKYGYADYDNHEIKVTIEVAETQVIALLEDDGREFNPLEQQTGIDAVSLETKQVGGLGIHLIKKMLDSMDYRREGRLNILEIRAARKAVDSAE